MTMLKVRHFFPDILCSVTACVTQSNVASDLVRFLIGLRMVAEIRKNEVKFGCFLFWLSFLSTYGTVTFFNKRPHVSFC